MDKVLLIDKNTHAKQGLSKDIESIKLSNNPTVVKIDHLNEKIVDIKKENNNVVIVLENGKKLLLKTFLPQIIAWL